MLKKKKRTLILLCSIDKSIKLNGNILEFYIVNIFLKKLKSKDKYLIVELWTNLKFQFTCISCLLYFLKKKKIAISRG
jgi:hypothetical protein